MSWPVHDLPGQGDRIGKRDREERQSDVPPGQQVSKYVTNNTAVQKRNRKTLGAVARDGSSTW